ncbi:hypothetical protein TWF102_010307 [Orbilia oligospora]|uniref:Uncharacterized protein n=1 Tax=Orbilia oligospora TaxID=2813651 RepID=A0A7C8JA37_ORBOL|nr:hypothetical protein TWF102_010307 [Orbilia oligospora]
MEDRIQLSRKEYTIGWLCSLPESELIAARSMLDVRHKKCELPSDDENLYTYGSISGHNIVIACMPPGIPRTSSTTKLVQPLSRNFPNMRIYLFIGIGSGIPRDPIPEDSQDDIHLGDVVVGWNKRPGIPSIVQCNFQRLEIGEDEHIGSLDKPDRRLLNALTTLQKNHSNGRTEFAEHVKRSRYSHPGLEKDHLYSNEYSAIFWLNATSKIELEKSARQAIWSIININTRNADTDTLEDSNQTYFRIAHSLGLDGRGIASDETLMGAAIESSPIKCLNHWLCRGSNSKWLLILDNYDDPAACAEVLDSLLPVDIGHVLITSRLQNSYGSCTDIEMFAGMEQQEAVELLHQISGKRATTEGSSMSLLTAILISSASLTYLEHQTVLAIVDSVGKLPLAIELIGAYIRKYSVPFDSYAESLGENLKERLGKIHAVCEISFRKLTREAKNMIQLLSLMGNEDIPYKFLEAGREVVNWMGSTRNALNKTIGELLSLRLISERHDNGYYIHPLVHRWVRDYTDNATFKNSLLVVNIVTSTFVFGDGRTQSQSAYQYRILPHIECCSEIFFKYLAPQSGAAVNDKSKRIAYNLARMYTNLGNIPKSSAIYERSLQNATGHPSCLELKMMDALGVSLRLQGEYDKALRWCTRALDGTKSQGGNDSSESLIITTHVAAILRARGDYSESIARYRWVLERQEEKIGYLHPQTLETRHQLAGALISSAEYAEALDLLEQVQEEKEKRLGKYHPSVLEIIDNIATILEAQGSYDEALRCYKLAYETRAHILGENHYSTLGSKSGIGRIYERLGQYEECLAQYGGVLEQLESMFGVGEDHPWVLRTFSNIADVLVCLERYNEAEKLYRKAYVGLKRLPMRVDGKIQIAEKIAGLLRDQGQYKEALQWSKEVELGYQKEQDEGSELLLAAKSCTASIHALEGNYETALDIYGQVLKSYEKKQGKTCYAEALWTELSMGKILIYQAKHQEAFELLARAEKGFSNLVGPDHYHTLEAAEFRNQAIRKLDEEFRQRQKEEEIRREEERKLREEERIVREQEAEQKLREQEAKRKLQEKEAERKKQEKEAERKLREQLEQVLRNQEEERRLQRQQEQKLLELEAARKLREEEAAQKLREQEAAQKLREQEAAQKLREQEAAQKLREQEEQKLRQQEEQKLRQQEREQRLREQEEERKLQEQEEERKLQEREAKRKLREQEEKRKLQEEERKLREEEEKKKLREEEEKKKLREEEEKKKLREEEEKKKLREEEEKRKLQEEERKLREEEEKKKLREEEEKKKLREEEEKREQQEKEFKEKLQKEELEREFQEREEKRLQEKELVLRQQEAERKLREQEEERRLQRQQEERQLHQDEEKKHRRQEEEEKEEEERKRWQEEKEKEVRKGKKKWKWGRLNCFKEY